MTNKQVEEQTKTSRSNLEDHINYSHTQKPRTKWNINHLPISGRPGV